VSFGASAQGRLNTIRVAELFSAAMLSASLLCIGCGYMGPPLPPALNLPNRVVDLTAVQRGSNIVVHFTMSKMTTEALPIKDPPEVDLRIGASGRTFNFHDWFEHARRIPAQSGATDFEIPITDYVGKDVVVAVRLVNDKGKDAGWSNFPAVLVTAAVPRPENLKAVATAQGVELTWSGDAAPLYRIYRKEDAGEFAPLGDTPKSPYVDSTAEYLKNYTYFIQGIQKNGDTASESERSDSASLTPKDIFPPAVPTNLKAIVGTKSVELSWTRNTESDLAGYRVYRSVGDGPIELLADKLPGASYSDRAVKSGHYRYAVRSYDLLNNESALSAPIDVLVP
jgi:hypothetical protein